VNGVEDFAGTTKDTSTWAGVPSPLSPGQTITQNNALFITVQGIVGYNTINQTVAWGQTVRMMFADTSTFTDMSLMLTNNSAGPNAIGAANSAFWSFDLDTNSASQFDRVIMGSGSNGVWGDGTIGIFTTKPLVNHTYGMQIQLLSATAAVFTLLDSDGVTVLESHTFVTPQPGQGYEPSSIPNFMHISLMSGSGSVTVYSVSILPDPCAAPLAAIVLLAVGRRKCL
jgi:hypothetical protein